MFDVYPFFQARIEKSCDLVNLVGVKLFLYGHYKENLVSLIFYNNDKDFKIVNVFTLFKNFYNLVSFVSLDITINISFVFEDSFCYWNMLIYYTLNKFPNFISNMGVILSLYIFFLFASFATPYYFLEAGFILYKAFTFVSNSNKSLKSLSWYII